MHFVCTLRYVFVLHNVAPETQHKGVCSISSDMFSLGMLMISVFCGGQPLIQANNNPNTYFKQAGLVSRADLTAAAAAAAAVAAAAAAAAAVVVVVVVASMLLLLLLFLLCCCCCCCSCSCSCLCSCSFSCSCLLPLTLFLSFYLC